uniref:C2H2-type domain-containing protein n=1 Tax=Syphacia muris TaxID=451379 RepID=A0A0N5ADY8_9BILA
MPEGGLDPSTGLTCISCRVVFANGILQREHYKSDWHRYNLQRKFSRSITSSDFRTEDNHTEPVVMFCKLCNKQFQSKNAFDNHLRSKKHAEYEKKAASNNIPSEKKEITNVEKKVVEKKNIVSTVDNEPDMFFDKEVSEDSSDSEGWVTDHGSDDEIDYFDESKAIPSSSCLFCSLTSESVEENLEHMSKQHGFFLPDIEYCVNIEGMLHYLGLKVGSGNLCLLCSDMIRRFRSVDACQKHMRDKAHCRVKHEAADMLEYEDFYDYSAMYPEKDDDEKPTIADSFSLILPSGAQVGHRLLMRYYKQRVRPTSNCLKANRGNVAVKNVVNQYKAIGWTGISGPLAVQRARDIRFMKRLDSKQWVKLGMQSNKLFKSRGRADQ